MSTNCVFAQISDWVVVVHSTEPPSTEEWAALLEFYKTSLGMIKGALVFTAGGAISAFQRKQLRSVFGDDERLVPLTAILTNSTIARLGITAFNLFIRGKIKAFDIHAPIEAMRYLNIPTELYPSILQQMQALALRINAPTPSYRL